MNGFCSQLVAAAGSIVARSRPLATEQKDRGWRPMEGVDTTGTHMKQLQLLHSILLNTAVWLDKVSDDLFILHLLFSSSDIFFVSQ